MAAPRRRPRDGQPRGRHFLRSRRLAAELVDAAAVGRGELVLEIGAGSGRLTDALAARGAEVLAVELDPELAAVLRRRAGAQVHVVEADALAVDLPERRYRAFGNLPFAAGGAILRRLLDDHCSPLERADLILQLEAVRKRAAPWPGTLRSLAWLPWWRLSCERRLAAACFEPVPSVDAALLCAARRRPALLPEEERPGFVALLEQAFARAQQPLRRTLAAGVSPRTWKRLARERGLEPDARPRDLQVWDWVAVYELAAISARARTRPRPAPRRASPGPGRSRPRR